MFKNRKIEGFKTIKLFHLFVYELFLDLEFHVSKFTEKGKMSKTLQP